MFRGIGEGFRASLMAARSMRVWVVFRVQSALSPIPF
jgi:hypothetical protein